MLFRSLLNAVRGMFSGPNAQGVTEVTNTAGEGDPGYGWKYYSDGTAISPDGVYYFQGNQVYDPLDQYTNTSQDWNTYNAWDQPGPTEADVSEP